MDRIILLPDTWALWTKSAVFPVQRPDLPQVFILIISPELYLYQNQKTELVLSDFQQQELDYLATTNHGVFRSYMLSQLIKGDGCLTLAGHQLWVHHHDQILFQSSANFDRQTVTDYLKRFGVIYQPEVVDLMWPSLVSLLRQPSLIDLSLGKAYQRAIQIQGLKGGLALLSFVLGVNVIQSGYSALQHWYEIKSYVAGDLTETEKIQARRYQSYLQLNRTLDLPHDVYDRFAQDWRGRLVVTTVAISPDNYRWQFVMHPDFKDQSHLVADWLDTHAPGSIFKESEGNEEYSVSISQAEGGL